MFDREQVAGVLAKHTGAKRHNIDPHSEEPLPLVVDVTARSVILGEEDWYLSVMEGRGKIFVRLAGDIPESVVLGLVRADQELGGLISRSLQDLCNDEDAFNEEHAAALVLQRRMALAMRPNA